MALKDWSKYQDDDEMLKFARTEKVNEPSALGIYANGDSFTDKIGVYVNIYFDNNKPYKEIKRNFKTKSQALKFAKQYMRSH